MSKHDTPVLIGRRRFFGRIGTVLGAVGAAVLLRPRRQAPAIDDANTAEQAPKRGYHVTEHIRKYYHKARF